MAYQPPFNPQPSSYPHPLFTPLSQLIPPHLKPALAASLASNLFPFSQFNPFPIYQQNNYYNTSLTYPDPALSYRMKAVSLAQNNSSDSFPFLQPKLKLYLQPKLFLQPKLMPKQRQLYPLKSNVIEISDDEEQKQVKPIVAVVKEKPVVNVDLQGRQRLQLALQRRYKQVIERGRVIEIKDTSENDMRRELRTVKNGGKVQTIKEIAPATKCKKINKEKSSYKFSEKEEHLMKLLEYRQYRPDLIMTGPRFQSKIPKMLLFSNGKQEWLGKLRQSLQLRRQHQH